MSQQDEDHQDEDQFLKTAQEKLIEAMEEISHEDEAGCAVKNLVSSTAIMLPLVAHEFIPETTTIFTPERVEEMLNRFGERLLSTQAEWATRWNKRRD